MKSAFSFTTLSLCAGLAALAVTDARAQAWTSAYTSATATGDCAALPGALNTGFATEKIVSQALFPTVAPYRVNKLAFSYNGVDPTDIFMTEKGGGPTAQARVLFYNGTTKTLTVVGTIPNVNYGSGSGNGSVDEQGVWGIALNPKTFATDHFIYLMYSTGAGAQGSATVGWRVSRFTYNTTTQQLDLASEKILLHIPAGTTTRWHTGGAMTFDNFGNLYISTGDNEALAMGPGNTADLRGGILRIKPDGADNKGYTIPAGNFGAYWGQKWADSGMSARATAYRDTLQVRPEIYVKGSRNPYGMSVDPNRPGLVAWSECGPDAQRGEEYNLTKKPAFSGWPFFAANGVRQTAKAGSYDEANDVTDWASFNPTTNTTTQPANNHAAALGVDSLPPMHIPTHTLGSGCAQGGAIIRYDGRINNPNKLPPHLDNTVFYGELGNSAFYGVKFDTATGANVGTVGTVFTMTKTGRPNLNNPVNMVQGPDGMLYVTDWGGGCCSGSPTAANGGVVRISYTGTCQDPGLFPAGTTAIASRVERGSVDWLRVRTNGISIMADGAHTVKILDLNGRQLYSMRGEGEAEYALPALAKGSLYVLRVETEQGIAVRTLNRF